MGGAGSKCCGGGATPTKDPADKYLDEVKYQESKIEKFDAVLEPAFDMINTVVGINNVLWQTVDTVKICGSLLLGSYEATLVVNDSDVKFVIAKPQEDGSSVPIAEIVGGTGADTTNVKEAEDYKKVTDAPAALTAIESASASLLTLNAALKETNAVGVKGTGRLLPVVGDDTSTDAAQKKQVADARLAIVGFNNTYFKVKLELMQMNMKEGLKQAVQEMIASIKKIVSDIKPTLSISYEKLMNGELDIKPDLGINVDKLVNIVPKKVKACLDALFGEKFLTTGDPLSEGGLIAELIRVASECAGLLEKFKEIKTGVEELVALGVSGISAELKESGLDPMSAMKAASKILANCKTATKTPLIITDTFKSIKEIGGEIEAGLTGSSNAAPAE